MQNLPAISAVFATIAGGVALGTAVPAYAQQDHRDRDQHRGGPPAQARGDRPRGPSPPAAPGGPAQAQPRPAPAPSAGGMRGTPPPQQPARPAPPPPGAANRPPPQRYAPPARPEAQAREWHAQGGWRRNDTWPQHQTWQEHRSQDWRADHRGWEQRGGYGGYYIPAQRFERHFGPRHFFRLHARPVIYEGYPQFRYGGYNFLIVDPWPAYWEDSWYARDELYISYDGDGYYLHNRRYPEVGLAVVVTL